MTDSPITTETTMPEEDLFVRFACTVDKGQTPLRVDKYLAEHIPGTSRNRVQQAITAEQVLVNGKIVSANHKVQPLDYVQVLLSHEPQEWSITPENIPLDIVYEDEDLLVVNKPAGLVVHPGHGNYEHTLLHALAYHFQEGGQALNLNNPDIGLVHRIDKDTSGLLLIAKTPTAKTQLGLQFFNHSTERAYNALIWGRPDTEEGTITGALARDTRDRTAYRVYAPEENPAAKEAVTHYRVLEHYPYTTLVECRLETGRTHQIRVHMAHIGHPLFADEKYGGMIIRKGLRTQKYAQFVENCFALCPRQVLHAKTLGFTHPRTGERMLFDSPWAPDFAAVIEKWRGYNRITNYELKTQY